MKTVRRPESSYCKVSLQKRRRRSASAKVFFFPLSNTEQNYWLNDNFNSLTRNNQRVNEYIEFSKNSLISSKSQIIPISK